MVNLPPPRARRVFIDTSAYFALADPRDANHRSATSIQQRLITERWWLYTTNLVIIETHALLVNRVGRGPAMAVLREMDAAGKAGQLHIVRAGVRDEERAREILEQYEDKDFSLTDATSFAVMERLSIQHAFSFDRDFAQYGVALLT
jgi:predicted nucleic acid-binding protein